MVVIYVVSKELLDEWIVVLWLVYFYFYFNNPSPLSPSTSNQAPVSQFPTCNQVTGHTLVDVSSGQDDDPLCHAT